jgi:hypothetical protein
MLCLDGVRKMETNWPEPTDQDKKGLWDINYRFLVAVLGEIAKDEMAVLPEIEDLVTYLLLASKVKREWHNQSLDRTAGNDAAE